MSDNSQGNANASSPLEEAQRIATDLINHTGTGAETLQSQLTALSALLVRAAADDAAMRAKLDKMANDAASFNSVMVHEIRKPMTSIRGYSDMLGKDGLIGPLNDMQKQFVGVIRNNVMHMEGLVSDISDINKLTYGRMKLDNKMTTVGQILMEVQKLAEAANAEYAHTLTFEKPDGLPPLTTDSKQLVKILMHLIKNAVYYTPKSGSVTVKAEALEGGKIRLSVIDTGIGMKPAEIARLGEPFYRADHDLVTGTKGYGLGIPVTMGFLRLMSSKLDVVSEPEKGSTFSFELQGLS